MLTKSMEVFLLMDEANTNGAALGTPAPKGHSAQWAGFADADLVDFFSAHKLLRLQAEDANGNKAKLSLLKDNSIKIEISSVSII